jgi:hypothetical protein
LNEIEYEFDVKKLGLDGFSGNSRRYYAHSFFQFSEKFVTFQADWKIFYPYQMILEE